MKLDEVVAWYQKRIGTYDKQQWEKSVEQRILTGIANSALTNPRAKNDYIDVDLVRGSSFPKAKPKQSLITVIRLAILRCLLLPLYSKWWVLHTSPKLFAILLFVYVSQIYNWGAYSLYTTKTDTEDEEIISQSELAIPVMLSLVLSFIHSQIVATNSRTGTSSKHKQMYNLNGKRRSERIRRRRKNIRMRSQEQNKTSTIQSETAELENSCRNVINKEVQLCNETLASDSVQATTSDFNNHHNTSVSSTDIMFPTRIDGDIQSKLSTSSVDICSDMLLNCTDTPPPSPPIQSNNINLLPLAESPGQTEDCLVNQKKRCVNWDSPIKNYASDSKAECTIQVLVQNDHDGGGASGSSSSRSSSSNTVNPISGVTSKTIIRTSSNAIKNNPMKTVRIDESVQEFYDNLIQQVEEEEFDMDANTNDMPAELAANLAEQTGEDDGFESLNGKSSSGEENPILLNSNILQASVSSPSNQIQQRLIYRGVRVKDANNAINSNETQNKESSPVRDDNPILNKRSSIIATDYQHGPRKNILQIPKLKYAKGCTERRPEDSSETDEEGDDGEIVSSPTSNGNYAEGTTSATEWLGITTNSEECSYCSEIDNSDELSEDRFDYDYAPAVILNPCGSRISCTVWDHRDVKKTEMSVLDISNCIIDRVEGMPETCDYIYIGLFFCVMLSFAPSFCRLYKIRIDSDNSLEINYFDVSMLLWEKSYSLRTLLALIFGDNRLVISVRIVAFFQRVILTFIICFLLVVAERTFKQRFLYAKLFSHLTSSRRARKSELPHFRLNKVRNIKTWLSVRSYLKRRGPQRSVDVIVSAAFILTLLLLAFLSVEWLKDSVHLHSQYNLEALLWCTALGVFLLRFMTLGNKINRKYRSISVLITEQINLYMQIEQKPKSKDELMVSNSVLKLAADLLKELESPFKISGLSTNPYLYTIIKVVILSAFSGVLSEMLGFKLKLHKIKIK